MNNKIKLKKLNPEINDNSLFVVCSSYEERCLSVAKNIDSSKIAHAIIAYNKEIAEQIGTNHKKLCSFFKNKHSKVELSLNDPVLTADNLRREIEQRIEGKDNVIIDITTFTHESLLILLKVFKLITNDKVSIKLFYSDAKDYFNSSNTDEQWLSKGIDCIRTILGFPGEVFSSRETHLIVLVGFENTRAYSLIQDYSPDYLSLGYGTVDGSISVEHQKFNEKFHSLVNDSASISYNVNNFIFDCNNSQKTRQAIAEQIIKFPDTNVVLAPMNTKISTVGVFLAACENESIQLCYAQPSRYNYDNYSTPGDSCYVLDV